MAYKGFKGVVAAVALTSLTVLMAPSSFAQDNGDGQREAWVKQCATDKTNNQKICIISQITPLSREVIPSISIRQAGDKKYIAAMLVPMGILLQPGVTLAIDGDKKATAQFVSCDVPGQEFQYPVPSCAAQAEVDDAFIQALRKGNELELVVVDKRNQPHPIPLTLAGFAKVYDGPGIDAQTAQKQTEDRIQQLNDESRKALIDKLKQLQDKQSQ